MKTEEENNMGTLAVPIVMLVILGVFGIFFLVVTKKQKDGLDRRKEPISKKENKNNS